MGPLCELVSTQLYDLILGKSVVPRTGSRTWYKNVEKWIGASKLGLRAMSGISLEAGSRVRLAN